MSGALLIKEKRLAIRECDEPLDFKSGRQDGY
jgi:hypothetical protein